MKHFCTLAMTRATELFQIVSEKSRVSLQGTVGKYVSEVKDVIFYVHMLKML